MNEGRQPPEPGQHGQPLGEIRVCQRCSYSPTLGAAAAYLTLIKLVMGGRRGSHPPAPPEPGVNLSAHRAPIIRFVL